MKNYQEKKENLDQSQNSNFFKLSTSIRKELNYFKGNLFNKVQESIKQAKSPQSTSNSRISRIHFTKGGLYPSKKEYISSQRILQKEESSKSNVSNKESQNQSNYSNAGLVSEINKIKNNIIKFNKPTSSRYNSKFNNDYGIQQCDEGRTVSPFTMLIFKNKIKSKAQNVREFRKGKLGEIIGTKIQNPYQQDKLSTSCMSINKTPKCQMRTYRSNVFQFDSTDQLKSTSRQQSRQRYRNIINLQNEEELEQNFDLTIKQRPKSAAHVRGIRKRHRRLKEQDIQTDESRDLQLKCRSSLIESPTTKQDRKKMSNNDPMSSKKQLHIFIEGNNQILENTILESSGKESLNSPVWNSSIRVNNFLKFAPQV